MIEIRYKTDMIKEGRTFELTISGHANYAKKGKDIVCAGVSALTIALIRTLNDMKDNNEAEIEIDVDVGHTKIKSLSRIYTDIIEAESAYDTVLRGFKHIAKEYPQNVKIM